jgi:hypothetical protein
MRTIFKIVIVVALLLTSAIIIEQKMEEADIHRAQPNADLARSHAKSTLLDRAFFLN